MSAFLLDMDIAGAAAVGMKTALVRTGRFAPGEAWPEGMDRPDWDTASLTELAAEFVAEGIFRVCW